jgi:hypothetical protein
MLQRKLHNFGVSFPWSHLEDLRSPAIAAWPEGVGHNIFPILDNVVHAGVHHLGVRECRTELDALEHVGATASQFSRKQEREVFPKVRKTCPKMNLL